MKRVAATSAACLFAWIICSPGWASVQAPLVPWVGARKPHVETPRRYVRSSKSTQNYNGHAASHTSHQAASGASTAQRRRTRLSQNDGTAPGRRYSAAAPHAVAHSFNKHSKVHQTASRASASNYFVPPPPPYSPSIIAETPDMPSYSNASEAATQNDNAPSQRGRATKNKRFKIKHKKSDHWNFIAQTGYDRQFDNASSGIQKHRKLSTIAKGFKLLWRHLVPHKRSQS